MSAVWEPGEPLHDVAEAGCTAAPMFELKADQVGPDPAQDAACWPEPQPWHDLDGPHWRWPD